MCSDSRPRPFIIPFKAFNCVMNLCFFGWIYFSFSEREGWKFKFIKKRAEGIRVIAWTQKGGRQEIADTIRRIILSCKVQQRGRIINGRNI